MNHRWEWIDHRLYSCKRCGIKATPYHPSKTNPIPKCRTNELNPMPSFDQEPAFELFPFFKLTPFDGWHIAISNYSGEAMTIRKQEFVAILQKLWKDRF